jgi:hypothetical protein
MRRSAGHQTRPRTDPHGRAHVVRGFNAVIVPGLIDPFRRSHIFAVRGGMMVVSGDVSVSAAGDAGASESQARRARRPATASVGWRLPADRTAVIEPCIKNA